MRSGVLTCRQTDRQTHGECNRLIYYVLVTNTPKSEVDDETEQNENREEKRKEENEG